jgi:hypothetical protein
MTSPDEQGQQIQENTALLGRLARKYSKLDAGGGFDPVDLTHVNLAAPFNLDTGEPTEGGAQPRRTGIGRSVDMSVMPGARSAEQLARDWPALRGRVRPGDG